MIVCLRYEGVYGMTYSMRGHAYIVRMMLTYVYNVYIVYINMELESIAHAYNMGESI